jgi:hypothetical protein
MTRAVTPPRRGAGRSGHGWQLILADLALILFLLTLSALPNAEAETGRQRAVQENAAREEDTRPRPEIAAAQTLFRPVAGGPSLGAWLTAQSPDPRATLTIFAVHATGGEADAWARAEALSAEARGAGARVRTIIAAGGEAEIYASLAYDSEPVVTP